MKIVDRAAKGVVKQVRRGLAVPDKQGNIDLDGMYERWSKGFQQNLTGKVMAIFIEDFLRLLDDDKLRQSIEADIKNLHGIASFDRFRKKVLLSFAIVYHNGALAQKRGVNVDIPQMVNDAIRSNAKAEGFPYSSLLTL